MSNNMSTKKYIISLALLSVVCVPTFSKEIDHLKQSRKIILADGNSLPSSLHVEDANLNSSQAKSAETRPEAVTFGNYSEIQAKADSGDPVAQYQMAFFLYNLKSDWVIRSYGMERYALASAEQGYAYAQAFLAVLYEEEQTEEGYAKAFKWAQKAADQNNPNGLFLLGYLYAKGLGVNQDKAKAIDLYKQSSNQGNSHAGLTLAYIYFQGDGVAVNYPEAVLWETKAADAGNLTAQKELAFIYLRGKVVQQNIDLADKYFEKAALQGNADDQLNYGVFIERDKKPQDLKKAAYWYEKSAQQGQSEAEFNFGLMNMFGAAGLSKNAVTGLSWIQKSAEQGNGNAQNFLGIYYSKIKEGSKDPVQAYAWFMTAQANGSPKAAENMLMMEKTLSPEQISQAKKLAEEYKKYKN